VPFIGADAIPRKLSIFRDFGPNPAAASWIKWGNPHPKTSGLCGFIAGTLAAARISIDAAPGDCICSIETAVVSLAASWHPRLRLLSS
jgi:hypothetical protein